jgi:hypothetical protein
MSIKNLAQLFASNKNTPALIQNKPLINFDAERAEVEKQHNGKGILRKLKPSFKARSEQKTKQAQNRPQALSTIDFNKLAESERLRLDRKRKLELKEKKLSKISSKLVGQIQRFLN